MNNDLLEILNDWNPWRQELKAGLERPLYLDRLQAHLSTNQIISITGPRRAGKSFLMRQLIQRLIHSGVPPQRILMVNFEDPRFGELNTKTLETLFKTYLQFLAPEGKPFLFLDEIQEVEEWEKWVRMMHELGKAKIILSGSNAKLLSRDLATLLTGRHLSVTVLPFSFQEMVNLKNPQNSVEQSRLIQECLEYGAFPEVVFSDRAERRPLLLQYYDDILSKDLIRRYKIRKPEALKSLARFYFTNQSSLTTYSSTEKFLKISADTVEKFSGYLEDAYLLFFLKRFSFKVKEQEKSPRKVYAVDTGLANTIGFRSSPNLGRLAEGWVFLELQRLCFLNPEMELFYWKDERHREVDFVVKQNQKVVRLIQSSWLASESFDQEQQAAKQREIVSLLKAMKELEVNEGWIVTSDFEAEEKVEGKDIYYIPLWKWLSGKIQFR